MKLKERVVAATFGFSLAIILVFLLESLELTNHERRAIPQDQSHGIINSQNVASASKSSSKTSSIKAFKQRNLQKTDSSGQHSEQNQLVNSAPIEGHQKTRLSENARRFAFGKLRSASISAMRESILAFRKMKWIKWHK